MKETTKIAILRELQRRVSANQNGLLQIFYQAGIPTGSEGEVTLADMNNLQITNPDIFAKAMEFLYPDVVKIVQANAANADDAATTAQKDSAFANVNWINVLGSTLSGFGNGLATAATASNSETELALANAQYQAALAEQEVESKSKTLTIVIVVAAVLLMGAIVALIIKKKK